MWAYIGSWAYGLRHEVGFWASKALGFGLFGFRVLGSRVGHLGFRLWASGF